MLCGHRARAAVVVGDLILEPLAAISLMHSRKRFNDEAIKMGIVSHQYIFCLPRQIGKRRQQYDAANILIPVRCRIKLNLYVSKAVSLKKNVSISKRSRREDGSIDIMANCVEIIHAHAVVVLPSVEGE